ncbi:putative pyridoxamine 5'-phosphate oxidase-like FMN-binding protein [Magnetofaba australis IT-1]|uniref:Putative pyridoxamine 5'-phosphate oxidase-like FMN-binding protein n=2 Tax=Magnetofaba TaxID=1472292 RepID=A0A1Y2K6P7_9PROT|nr:putative pyridoxamine 5'-phosphate oxidase-like FMN-binding protein [Magnetofaba australis IT-1]
MEETKGWSQSISDELAAFIAAQRSFFLATVSSEGAPYIQHRGGPPGFLRIISPTRLGFVDFKGNKQFITQGNLVDNPKAHILLIDYAKGQRVKLWGEAQVVEGDQLLIQELMPQDYQARAEQVILFDVSAWDINCPKHIPRRYEHVDVERAIQERDARIAELEAKLRGAL